jgi:hypothetical protein
MPRHRLRGLALLATLLLAALHEGIAWWDKVPPITVAVRVPPLAQG